ncbi:MAG TPA: hypothetical protein VNH18_36550, partial [Bryobacteraceae bacterium]|nr:hypothetical protein [Bryobacteraceae bacterium]
GRGVAYPQAPEPYGTQSLTRFGGEIEPPVMSSVLRQTTWEHLPFSSPSHSGTRMAPRQRKPVASHHMPSIGDFPMAPRP